MKLRAVAGQVTSEDREWQRIADRAERDDLTELRTLASRWALTIGSLVGLLGIFSLVFGQAAAQKLPIGWRIATGGLVIAAILAAGLATWWAASAAQGRLVETRSTYARVRDVYRQELSTARSRLRSSRVAVAVAAIALLAAIVVSWFAPSEQKVFLVVRQGDRVQCLPLDGTLTVSVVVDSSVDMKVGPCPAA